MTKNHKKKSFISVSSLDVDVQMLAKCVRGHWEVDNKAHWVLDVVYKEDECAVTNEWGADQPVGQMNFEMSCCSACRLKNRQYMRLP